jgi:hypothetical protein
MLQKIQDGKIFSILPMALIMKKLGDLFKKVYTRLGGVGEVDVIFMGLAAAPA